MTNQFASLDQVRSILIDRGMEFGPRLVVAAIIITAGYFAARWAGRMANRGLNRFQLEPPVRLLLVRLIRLFLMGLFLIMALQNLGVQLLPLIAGLGVAGAGVALAMQGVLGNIAAGLTIIFTRPFRVGEYVSIAGEEGRVEFIDIFTTRLSHTDLSTVVIPNRKIVGEILHNYGRIRQLEVTASVAYDTDLNLALTAIREVLATNPRVLKDPAPVIQIAGMADSSVTIAIKPWVAVGDWVPTPGELNQALLETFRERNIVVPFPQREIRILTDDTVTPPRRAG